MQAFELIENNRQCSLKIEYYYSRPVIRRHLSTCSSIVMVPHNSLITSENLLDG